MGKTNNLRQQQEMENKKLEELKESEYLNNAKRYALDLSPSQKPKFEKEETKKPKDDWEKILAAYRSKYKKEPEKDQKGRPVLSFESEEEAHNFFEDMAKEGHTFAVKEINSAGAPTGNIKFSLGEGQLYEAKLNPQEVEKFVQKFSEWNHTEDAGKKAKLRDDLLQMINPNQNTLSSMRGDLKKIREEVGVDQRSSFNPTPRPF